jgi:hypothetical protein
MQESAENLVQALNDLVDATGIKTLLIKWLDWIENKLVEISK